MSVSMFIGITQRLVDIEGKEVRECLACEWGAFLLSYDVMPLPLSYSIPFSHYAPYLSGVILSGGNDLSSVNDTPLSHRRDSYEKEIIAHCIKHHIALFGVCRGAQIIATYFASSIAACVGHVKPNSTHEVCINDNAHAPHIYRVNSYHNFCITYITKPLIPIARARDASIEAFRHESLPIFATMWHIEREKGMTYKDMWEEFLHISHLRASSYKGNV